MISWQRMGPTYCLPFLTFLIIEQAEAIDQTCSVSLRIPKLYVLHYQYQPKVGFRLICDFRFLGVTTNVKARNNNCCMICILGRWVIFSHLIENAIKESGVVYMKITSTRNHYINLPYYITNKGQKVNKILSFSIEEIDKGNMQKRGRTQLDLLEFHHIHLRT